MTLRVQDGQGGVDLQSFTINVTQANTPPSITSKPKGPAVVGVPWVYQVKAQDAESDPITFSLGAHPDGMTHRPEHRPGHLDPDREPGRQPACRDHRQRQPRCLDHAVLRPARRGHRARRPARRSPRPRAGRSGWGRRTCYQVVATDPNGDKLTYSVPTAPIGMTIDPNSGLVTWKPTADQLGANPVQVRVDDGRGGLPPRPTRSTSSRSRSTTRPSITSNPPQAATVGKLYAYDLKGSDPDNDPLVWSLDTAPTGMSIDPTLGTLRWTPTADELGSQNVVVRVIDGQGGFATQSYADHRPRREPAAADHLGPAHDRRYRPTLTPTPSGRPIPRTTR